MFIRSFNLQDLCLIAIVRDIDFFAFNRSIPQKHVDFLFRAYSDEVISKHKVFNESMDENCMLWFLNSHVKKVTVPYVFHTERVIQQLKMIGFGITSLNFYSEITENELNSIIYCIPHVVHLNLSVTKCSDETLACIEKSCPNLESLNVSSCEKVTDCGMENLCRGKLLLKNLNIKHTQVTSFGIISVLEKMPSLECIEYLYLAVILYQISNNQLSLEYIEEFQNNKAAALKRKISNNKQYNLRELIYDNPETEDDPNSDSELIQACVRLCPKLKKLHFAHSVYISAFSACAYFQNLVELKIKMSSHSNDISKKYDVLTPILSISKTLKTLILSCAEISLVKLVECFQNLESLYLKSVSFTPFEKKDIKISQTNLLTLVMKDIDMKGTTYSGVTSLITLSKNVSKLYLTHIQYLPSEIFDVILKSMKKLTLLSFRCTPVDMKYVNPFFEISSMSTIVVDENISTVARFGKSGSCTLSWNNIRNFEIKDDNEESHDNKYYYDAQERDESDNISNQCYCSDEDFVYFYRGPPIDVDDDLNS